MEFSFLSSFVLMSKSLVGRDFFFQFESYSKYGVCDFFPHLKSFESKQEKTAIYCTLRVLNECARKVKLTVYVKPLPFTTLSE